MKQTVRFAAVAALFVAVLACRKVPNTPMDVAEECYRALIEERWDDYVSTTADADSLPADVRRERIDMVREYMAFESELRGGLTAARALRDTLVAPDYAYVYVELQWADSVTEEVMVPMVRVGEKWRVR